VNIISIFRCDPMRGINPFGAKQAGTAGLL
jgi:hypothetical protein